MKMHWGMRSFPHSKFYDGLQAFQETQEMSGTDNYRGRSRSGKMASIRSMEEPRRMKMSADHQSLVGGGGGFNVFCVFLFMVYHTFVAIICASRFSTLVHVFIGLGVFVS